MYGETFAQAMNEDRFPSQQRIDQVLELRRSRVPKRARNSWKQRLLSRSSAIASPREHVAFVPPF